MDLETCVILFNKGTRVKPSVVGPRGHVVVPICSDHLHIKVLSSHTSVTSAPLAGMPASLNPGLRTANGAIENWRNVIDERMPALAWIGSRLGIRSESKPRTDPSQEPVR
jgi:hypothetical protein